MTVFGGAEWEAEPARGVRGLLTKNLQESKKESWKQPARNPQHRFWACVGHCNWYHHIQHHGVISFCTATGKGLTLKQFSNFSFSDNTKQKKTEVSILSKRYRWSTLNSLLVFKHECWDVPQGQKSVYVSLYVRDWWTVHGLTCPWNGSSWFHMTLIGSIGKIQMTEDQDVDFFPPVWKENC